MLNSIFGTTVTATAILIMLGSALVLGILNAFVFSYKKGYSGGFALTLSLIPMISSVIIFLVNDHLGAGVAAAGAFTLVRFRSVAGSGRQLVAIFSSMALGLVLGMGYVGLAVIVFLIIALATIVLTACHFGGDVGKQVCIVVPENMDYEGMFDDVFQKYATQYRLERVRTINMGTLFELTYRVSLKDKGVRKAFLDEIRVRNGNMKVAVGDYPEGDCI